MQQILARRKAIEGSDSVSEEDSSYEDSSDNGSLYSDHNDSTNKDSKPKEDNLKDKPAAVATIISGSPMFSGDNTPKEEKSIIIEVDDIERVASIAIAEIKKFEKMIEKITFEDSFECEHEVTIDSIIKQYSDYQFNDSIEEGTIKPHLITELEYYHSQQTAVFELLADGQVNLDSLRRWSDQLLSINESFQDNTQVQDAIMKFIEKANAYDTSSKDPTTKKAIELLISNMEKSSIYEHIKGNTNSPK